MCSSGVVPLHAHKPSSHPSSAFAALAVNSSEMRLGSNPCSTTTPGLSCGPRSRSVPIPQACLHTTSCPARVSTSTQQCHPSLSSSHCSLRTGSLAPSYRHHHIHARRPSVRPAAAPRTLKHSWLAARRSALLTSHRQQQADVTPATVRVPCAVLPCFPAARHMPGCCAAPCHALRLHPARPSVSEGARPYHSDSGRGR